MAWYSFLIPQNMAQGVKMALQTAADVVGVIPGIGGEVQTVLNTGAMVAGMCDPHSTYAAEIAEAGGRIAIGWIPGGGLAKRLAVDGGRILLAGTNIGINYAEGKFNEIEQPNQFKILVTAFKEQGVDFFSLDAEKKESILKKYYESMEKKGFHTVDAKGNRLSEDSFVAYASAQKAEPEIAIPTTTKKCKGILTEAQVAASVNAAIRAKYNLSDEAVLTDAQKQEYFAAYMKSSTDLKTEGFQVWNEEQLAEVRKEIKTGPVTAKQIEQIGAQYTKGVDTYAATNIGRKPAATQTLGQN